MVADLPLEVTENAWISKEGKKMKGRRNGEEWKRRNGKEWKEGKNTGIEIGSTARKKKSFEVFSLGQIQ